MTPQEYQVLKEQINHFGIQYENFVDIQKAFLKADTDKDEIVTIEEFVKSVYGLGQKYSKEKFNFFINNLRTAQNG